jgi:hypothetical protein
MQHHAAHKDTFMISTQDSHAKQRLRLFLLPTTSTQTKWNENVHPTICENVGLETKEGKVGSHYPTVSLAWNGGEGGEVEWERAFLPLLWGVCSSQVWGRTWHHPCCPPGSFHVPATRGAPGKGTWQWSTQPEIIHTLITVHQIQITHLCILFSIRNTDQFNITITSIYEIRSMIY